MNLRDQHRPPEADLEELGRIGRNEHGGISRPSFSPADLEARAWLRGKIEAAGLCYRQDGAGNQFGRLEGAGKTVMAGSHIDTVPNGGMFDGAVGVLAALEAARRIVEEKIPLTKSLEIASFTDEEGNLVGDFLGSRAFMGLLDESEVRHGRTSFGMPFADVLEKAGFTADGILAAHKDRPALEAYLELHIEQGPVLEEEGLPIGIVERISGKHYRQCAFVGESGHAGTTPLELRHDAFLGLADFALKATQHVATKHYGSMLTIGRAALHPGLVQRHPRPGRFHAGLPQRFAGRPGRHRAGGLRAGRGRRRDPGAVVPVARRRQDGARRRGAAPRRPAGSGMPGAWLRLDADDERGRPRRPDPGRRLRRRDDLHPLARRRQPFAR